MNYKIFLITSLVFGFSLFSIHAEPCKFFLLEREHQVVALCSFQKYVLIEHQSQLNEVALDILKMITQQTSVFMFKINSRSCDNVINRDFIPSKRLFETIETESKHLTENVFVYQEERKLIASKIQTLPAYLQKEEMVIFIDIHDDEPAEADLLNQFFQDGFKSITPN